MKLVQQFHRVCRRQLRTLALEAYPSDDTGQFSTGPSYYSNCNQRRKEKPGDKAKGWRGVWEEPGGVTLTPALNMVSAVVVLTSALVM